MGDDLFGRYLDPAGDGRRAYLFGVTPLGMRMDGVRLAGEQDDDVAAMDGVQHQLPERHRGPQAVLAVQPVRLGDEGLDADLLARAPRTLPVQPLVTATPAPDRHRLLVDPFAP